MKKYGSKDIMRMDSIKEKSNGDYRDPGGDFMTTMMYAFNMSTAITDPGKAMARGYAAQEAFGEHSPIAAVFFERAYNLGGTEVRPMASENSWSDVDEDDIFSDIPVTEQPASRRPGFLVYNKFPKRSRNSSDLIALGRINVIKGSGPQFDLYDYPAGTIEVWKTEKNKPRIIYVNNFESNYLIGESRDFKFDGKTETWNLSDWIETEYISNLGPIYGKSLLIYNYD